MSKREVAQPQSIRSRVYLPPGGVTPDTPTVKALRTFLAGETPVGWFPWQPPGRGVNWVYGPPPAASLNYRC